MPKKYVVVLNDEQRAQLDTLIRRGRESARKLNHARILLKADGATGTAPQDKVVAAAVETSVRTVERVRRRFALEGLDAALCDRPQPKRPHKRRIDGKAEAQLVALACSTPPEGRGRWTLDLLAEHMVTLRYVDEPVSGQTVRRVLKKTRSSRG